MEHGKEVRHMIGYGVEGARQVEGAGVGQAVCVHRKRAMWWESGEWVVGKRLSI